jgi:hypothetical protein
MKVYNRQTILWGLEELIDKDEQIRTWLSNGSTGEVSSFTEAVCTVFDGGLINALDQNKVPEPYCALFRALQSLTREIDANASPAEIIDNPVMSKIRETAIDLLAALSKDASD